MVYLPLSYKLHVTTVGTGLVQYINGMKKAFTVTPREVV